MKTRITLALLLPSLTGWAQLVNDGATLTVAAGASLYVDGPVQNKAGSTLTNAGTVQLTGDLNNAGTLASSGTLLFAGSSKQVFTPGPATVATLTLNNSGASGQNILSLPADLTVGTALNLQGGLLRTAPAATLTLPDGATLSGEQTGRYVQGNLRIIRAAGSGVLDFGHGIALDRGGLGQVTITRTAGLLTDNLSRGVNFGNPSRQGIDRIWTVETTVAPAAPVPVTLQWLADDDNGLVSFASTQAWRAGLASAQWGAVGQAKAASVNGSTRSFSFSTALLGRLTLSNSESPLPVELTVFTATAQNADALLQWATATEKNNDHFEVEASADGKVFSRIGWVAGAGNTTQPRQYQLVDKDIARYAADPVYYRLRQIDTDGTPTYSPVRTVRVSELAGFAAQLYPNPVHSADAPVLLVRTAEAGAVSWQLTDALGRTVRAQVAPVPAGASTMPLGSLTNLATGVYLVRVQQGSQHQALKLVKE